MHFAQELVVLQGKLFPGRQLPLARVTSETGQVVYIGLGPSDPVACLYVAAAPGTPDITLPKYMT
jgi:hypothetical protein